MAYLSSDEASWVTGVCLSIDGGLHLRAGQDLDAWVRREHPAAPAWWGVKPAPQPG